MFIQSFVVVFEVTAHDRHGGIHAPWALDRASSFTQSLLRNSQFDEKKNCSDIRPRCGGNEQRSGHLVNNAVLRLLLLRRYTRSTWQAKRCFSHKCCFQVGVPMGIESGKRRVKKRFGGFTPEQSL